MSVHCSKCCCTRSGDAIGDPCRTDGCGGIVERAPEFIELVDTLPEPMTCGRRAGWDTAEVFTSPVLEGNDRWQKFKSNNDRVCSFCGSLHPEDMFALVREAANAPDDAKYGTIVEIEPSDKNYKVYVRRPGVRNAHEGGIKFYMQHLPTKADGSIDVTPEQQEEYGRAVKASRERCRRNA